MTKDVAAGQELFCDYGYIDQFIQTETAIHTIYQMGRWWTNKTEHEYHQEMKKHIKYIRDTVDAAKPFLEGLKKLIV